ncbi:class I SAM-dependent methyltransferase [Leucobacter komagatae]|uniref:class I SAM-dependent methyltransferase n=1 Tax=Leucobacter komagatae TaxID=55969 RepID=UPI0005ABD76E|nr:methyltransferase domain-containing protein [Leucobacter komagatae]
MDFEEQLASSPRCEGWDFSPFGDRFEEADPPWDYARLAFDAALDAENLLDMGTGGGEFLHELITRLGPRAPASISATEAWNPNVPIARTRLALLGVHVSQITTDSSLPYADAAFDLVINRHEAFDAAEINRVMRPQATFLTQQVGGEDLQELNELMAAPPAEYAAWSLRSAAQQLTDNGFSIEHAEEARVATRFTDVGALVGFLRAIPWQIPDFTVERYRDQLRALHDRVQLEGPITAQGHRFLIRARSPVSGDDAHAQFTARSK